MGDTDTKPTDTTSVKSPFDQIEHIKGPNALALWHDAVNKPASEGGVLDAAPTGPVQVRRDGTTYETPARGAPIRSF